MVISTCSNARDYASINFMSVVLSFSSRTETFNRPPVTIGHRLTEGRRDSVEEVYPSLSLHGFTYLILSSAILMLVS